MNSPYKIKQVLESINSKHADIFVLVDVRTPIEKKAYFQSRFDGTVILILITLTVGALPYVWNKDWMPKM